MDIIKDLKNPIRVICHFAEDEELSERVGNRFPLYQVTLDPDPSWYSPCGNYIRFNSGESEIHGWVHVDSLIVDTILAEEIKGEWQIPQHKGCVVKIATQIEEIAHG